MSVHYVCPSCKTTVDLKGDKPYQAAVICPRCQRWMDYRGRRERDEVSIFVFGSNRAGRHGKGAALTARQQHGAIYGRGEGRQGNAYAIPTKGERLERLTLAEIRQGVERFLAYASANPQDMFQVTRIGCGLAGYSDTDISPMFIDAPANCELPEGWGCLGEIVEGGQVVCKCDHGKDGICGYAAVERGERR